MNWISVYDKLPDHGDAVLELVLVWVRSDKGCHAETSMLYPDGTWSHLRSEETVTHWMPLPPPPEAAKGKE